MIGKSRTLSRPIPGGRLRLPGIMAALVLMLPASFAAASQLEDNLSAYTGKNAEGYLSPLRDSIGSTLNTGLITYPSIPAAGFHVTLDARGMLAKVSDEDRTFKATTEDYFGGEPQTVDAPTIYGDTESKTITDPGTGAPYTFPGGFDIDRFAMAVPQITVGSFLGTELIGRYISVSPSNFEVDKIETWGVGARHSLNHWWPDLGVDLSIFGLYQNLKVDEELIDSKAWTAGGALGKTFGIFSAWGSIAYDSVGMKSTYESDVNGTTQQTHVELADKTYADFGVGATLKLGFFHVTGEFHAAEQNTVGFGAGIGF